MPAGTNLGDNADDTVERLRADARIIKGWAEQEERPTLTGFGLNLLYGTIIKAADRIEQLEGLIYRCCDPMDATSEDESVIKEIARRLWEPLPPSSDHPNVAMYRPPQKDPAS